MHRLIPWFVVAIVVAVASIVVTDRPTSPTTSTTVATSTSSSTRIHENFTLLACDKRTTIGLEGCAEHRILAQDRRITQLRDRIVRRTHNAARQDFLLAESAWFAYRQAACRSESDANAGGSLAPLVFAWCALRLDQQHVTELRVQLSSLAVQ